MEIAFFYLFAALSISSALAVVFFRQALYGALSLIVCFASIAALFIQLGAQFLGAIQMIVYAGAIMVLFLFVIMLLDPKKEHFTRRKHGTMFVGGGALVVFLSSVTLRSLMARPPDAGTAGLAESGTIAAVARSLFSDYLLPFELTSILILVAVLGAMVLAKHSE